MSTSVFPSDLAVSTKRRAEAYAPVLIAARLSNTLSMGKPLLVGEGIGVARQLIVPEMEYDRDDG